MRQQLQMIRSSHILTLVIALPLIGIAQRRMVVSPNHHLRASIFSVKKNCPENRLVIFKQNGAVIYRKDFSSSDCQHGGVIVHDAWTPDSQFFVFDVESTGGHQPGHLPVSFYSRRERNLYRLEDFVGYLIAQDFVLEAPDILKTRKQKVPGGSEDIPIAASLSGIVGHRYRRPNR